MRGPNYYSTIAHPQRIEPSSIYHGAGAPTSKGFAPGRAFSPADYYGPEGTLNGGQRDRPNFTSQPYLQPADYIKTIHPDAGSGNSSNLSYPNPSERQGSGPIEGGFYPAGSLGGGSFGRQVGGGRPGGSQPGGSQSMRGPGGFGPSGGSGPFDNGSNPMSGAFPGGSLGGTNPMSGAFPAGSLGGSNDGQQQSPHFVTGDSLEDPNQGWRDVGGGRPDRTNFASPNRFGSTDKHFPNPHLRPASAKKPDGGLSGKFPNGGQSVLNSTGKPNLPRNNSSKDGSFAAPSGARSDRPIGTGKKPQTGGTGSKLGNRTPTGQGQNSNKGPAGAIKLEDGFMTNSLGSGANPNDSGPVFNSQATPDGKLGGNQMGKIPGPAGNSGFGKPTPRDLNSNFGAGQGSVPMGDRDPTFMPNPNDNSRQNNIAGFTPGDSRYGTSPNQQSTSGPQCIRGPDNRFPGNPDGQGNIRAPLSPIFEENTRFADGSSPSPIQGNPNMSGSIGNPFSGSADRNDRPGQNQTSPLFIGQGNQAPLQGNNQPDGNSRPHPVFDSPGGPAGPYPGQFDRPYNGTTTSQLSGAPGQYRRPSGSEVGTSKIVGRLQHHQDKVGQMDDGGERSYASGGNYPSSSQKMRTSREEFYAMPSTSGNRNLGKYQASFNRNLAQDGGFTSVLSRDQEREKSKGRGDSGEEFYESKYQSRTYTSGQQQPPRAVPTSNNKESVLSTRSRSARVIKTEEEMLNGTSNPYPVPVERKYITTDIDRVIVSHDCCDLSHHSHHSHHHGHHHHHGAHHHHHLEGGHHHHNSLNQTQVVTRHSHHQHVHPGRVMVHHHHHYPICTICRDTGYEICHCEPAGETVHTEIVRTTS